MNHFVSRHRHRLEKRQDQSGINMVDLMMWLVIAALMLAAAIQGIGYYQQAAYVYQAKNDVTHGHEWAAATTSITSNIPTLVDMTTALADDDYNLSNDNDSALLAAQGQSYCLGVEAGNVLGDNVFYAHSDSPNNIIRAAEMPEDCGDLVAVRGPNAPAPGGENGGSDGGNIANDMDDDGITNDVDDDLDGDGLLNNNDGDVDGDGTQNASDADIDGDGFLNAEDETPNGTQNKITFSEPTGTPAIDPRVSISDVNYLPDRQNIQVMLNIDTFGIPNNTGPYYGLSVRITCQLDDGTRYFKYNWMWSSYEGDSDPNPTHNFACPAAGTPVGYVVGAAYADPALKENSGQKGPKNVGKGGAQSLTGNTEGVPSFGSYIDPKVSLRSVKYNSTQDAIIIGQVLDLGGVSGSKYYGLSWRLTCQLPDGSQFFRRGSMYTTYTNAQTYPAPDYTTPACGGGSTLLGYVAGTYQGAPELTDASGHNGPTNTIASGFQSLNNDPGIAPTNTGFDPNVTVRNVTYNGAIAKIGLNLDLSTATTSGKYWGYSYRLTCEATNGTKSYVSGSLYTTYDNKTFPAPTYDSKSCPTGTTVVGHVVGQDRAHAALTVDSGMPGPKNVLVGGKQ